MVHDMEQFIREYSAHERDLRYYITSLVANKSNVDDILQETAAIIWKKYEGRDFDRPFLPWALAFAFNTVRKFRNKEQTRVKYFSDELIDVIAATHSEHYEELSKQRLALKAALKRLSERDRLLVEHRYSRDGTIQDLAEALGVKPDALYKRLQRIREKLVGLVELEMKRV